MEDQVRVVRVLEFVGPREWIEGMQQKNWLSVDRPAPFVGVQTAREISYLELPQDAVVSVKVKQEPTNG